ncbi:MAG: FAD-dependent oxidoreductase [Clostridia bacterium]|nr:FAD-dependent oxidoreductase [Clostridia bacterium]
MYISEVKNGEVVKTEVGSVTFDKAYDVIVSGLGTAGAHAAAFAAENGLSVLGVESFNCVGGTQTIGGIQGHYFGCPGGRYVAMDEKIMAFKDARTRNRLESQKIIQEKWIIDNGAEILYESSIIGVYMEDNTVVGAKIITPDGIIHVASKVMMDCTGDAYTAHMAGCKSEYGRKFDGLTQPYSMVSSARMGVGVRTTNCDFGRVDQRDDKGLSEALVFSRAYEMKEERGNSKFMIHMPLIGVREGRRIVAEQTVTVDGLFADEKTTEPAFYSYADLDKHGWDIAFDGPSLGDWSIGANLGAYNVTVPVPYKIIVPVEIDGIIVPCRALGVDRDIASCVRMVPDMKKLAELGADMAMFAIKNNCKLREVEYEPIRDRMLASGNLDHSFDRGYRIDGWRNWDGNPLVREDVTFMTDPAQLEARLATDTPGQAIWSAKRMGTKANETLKGLLASEDENTRKHTAFALAITGDDSGVEILRAMVKDRDQFMLHDCRKHNQQRGCMAIYHLGKLGDAEIADTLIEIISDADEVKRPTYNKEFAMGTRYSISDFNNEFFQFVSNAVVALIRIADAHPELQGKIAAAFKAAFEDDTYYDRITTRPKMSSEGGMAINIKNVAYAAIARWGK